MSTAKELRRVMLDGYPGLKIPVSKSEIHKMTKSELQNLFRDGMKTYQAGKNLKSKKKSVQKKPNRQSRLTDGNIQLCKELSILPKTIVFGGCLYRTRWWDNKKPNTQKPMFFTIHPADLYHIMQFRIEYHPMGKEVGNKEWPNLLVDVFNIEQPLDLIAFTGEWGYVQLEDYIISIDKSYKRGITSHKPGKIPDGNNEIPSAWLAQKKHTDGWYEPHESNGYLAEMMLTPMGVKKLSLVSTVGMKEILDEAFKNL